MPNLEGTSVLPPGEGNFMKETAGRFAEEKKE